MQHTPLRRLRGQTILITGASSGLGRALAVALSHGDNNLIVTARRKALLDTLADEVVANGSRCLAIAADATDPDAARAVLDAANTTFGPIDTAFVNAGGGKGISMGTPGMAADAVLAEMRRNYDTLVVYLIPLIAQMRARGGTIAWTGSPAGSFGLPRSGPYSAAKAAGRILLETCRIELADTPIRFVSLYPGFTYTDGLDPKEVPFAWLILQPERAVAEMLWAVERGRDQHMFPRRIAWLIAVARLLPDAVRRFILSRFVR